MLCRHFSASKKRRISVSRRCTDNSRRLVNWVLFLTVSVVKSLQKLAKSNLKESSWVVLWAWKLSWRMNYGSCLLLQPNVFISISCTSLTLFFASDRLTKCSVLLSFHQSLISPVRQEYSQFEGTRMAGGIEFKGQLRDLYLTNLWSHIASRVLLRLSEFKATNFTALEKHAALISWSKYLKPGSKIAIRGILHLLALLTDFSYL